MSTPQWPGMYAWLLAATRKPITAIASYDAEAALKLCLAFGRTGITTSHFRTLSTPAKVCTSRPHSLFYVTLCAAPLLELPAPLLQRCALPALCVTLL